MTAHSSTDVLIVGGGIVGTSTALALRQKGIRVTILERDLCGARSSGVNFGGVRRQGRPVSQMDLAQRAHAIWGDLERRIGIDGEYQRCGHLKLARSTADFDALSRYFEVTKSCGLGLQMYTGAELRRKFAGIGPEVVGGSFCPEDGQANPRLVAPGFARAAAAAGAVIHEHAEMVAAEHDGSRFTVRTANGLTVKADALLNSAGAWSGSLAERFGDRIPLRQGNPAMAVTEPMPWVLPWSLGVEGGSIYCRQVARGNLVFGGGPGRAVGPDRARTCTATLLAQFQRIAEVLPQFAGASVIRTWSGSEAYTPDKLPVIGQSNGRKGLFHAFGFSGSGFQIGPAVGEVMAELIAEGSTRTAISAFGLERFGEPLPSETKAPAYARECRVEPDPTAMQVAASADIDDSKVAQ